MSAEPVTDVRILCFNYVAGDADSEIYCCVATPTRIKAMTNTTIGYLLYRTLKKHSVIVVQKMGTVFVRRQMWVSTFRPAVGDRVSRCVDVTGE